MFKRLSLFLVTLILVSGCGGTNNSSSIEEGFTEVRFALKSSENENAGWLQMIDAANELLYPEKIQITPQIIVAETWPDYYTKLISKMASRTGPTIGRIAESFIPQMISMNQIADVTEVVESLNMDDYHRNAFEGVINQDGKYYGLPTGIYHMMTFYNKNAIDKYNENATEKLAYPSKDWTSASDFTEIRKLAKALTSGVGANRKFGLSAAPYLAYAGMYSVSLGGKNIFNDDGSSAINSESFHQVYDWFDQLLIEDYSMPKVTDTVINSAYDMFLQQRVSMMVDGSWWIPSFKEVQAFEIGITATPTGVKNGQAYSSQFVDAFFMLRTANNKEANIKVLKALMSLEANIALASTGVGGIPVHKGAQDAFIDTLRDKFTQEDIDCYLEGLNYTLPVPYTTFYETVDQAINQKMSSWLIGNMTTENFVLYMDQQMKDAIKNG